MAGQIPADGLSRELAGIYHYAVEGRDRATGRTGPQHLNYSASEAPREMMTEAIRQYLAAPDTLKERAPRVAKRICGYVNADPQISPIIQFNSLAVPATAALGLAASQGNALRGDRRRR